MATFLNDTFTDTNGTLLSAHTGETGATWTIHPAQTTTVQIAANRARSNGTAFYYASGTPANADYDVEADVYVADVSASSQCAVVGRMDTTANTMYYFGPRREFGAYHLLKITNGNPSVIGSLTGVTFTAGETVTIKLEMRGNQISGYVGGVRIIGPITDTSITAAGKAGLRFLFAGSDTTGLHADNITATDPVTVVDLTGASAAASATFATITIRQPQFARPTADVTDGTWTDQAGGTSLFAAIGEAVASDADYIQSANATTTADVSEVALGSLPDPLSSTGHIVRYRYGKDIDSGDVVNLTVSLRQGTGTQIAAWTHTNVALGPTTVAQTLTAAQADAITDYSALRLRFSAIKV